MRRWSLVALFGALTIFALCFMALTAPQAACPEGIVSSAGQYKPIYLSDDACRNQHTSPLRPAHKAFTSQSVHATEVPGPYTAYPYRTIGRLNIRWPDGSATACTASSIGNQAIWTAGHCVYQTDRGGWAAEVKFAPAYIDGNAPYDWWFAKTDGLWTMESWIAGGQAFGMRRDMGGAILNLNTKGEKISDVVGWLGFSWGQPSAQYYNFFGYPGDPSPPFPSDASRMFSCKGQNTGPAGLICCAGLAPDMQKMECDMGHGASGGPWITDFSPTPGQTDFLNGNDSLRLESLYPGESVSPYFDDAANNLWTCLVEGC